MKAILAVSEDGYVARGPSDDMKWTGSLDKGFFKMYTMQKDAILLAGTTTYKSLPTLEGRTILPVDRKSFPYYVKNRNKENYICIGGWKFFTELYYKAAINEIVVSYIKNVQLNSINEYNIFNKGMLIPKLDQLDTTDNFLHRCGWACQKIFENSEIRVEMFRG